MSVYVSKKSLEKYGSADEVRDPSQLLSKSSSLALCLLFAPLGAVAFAVFMLFMWILAIPLAAAGLLYVFFGGRKPR